METYSINTFIGDSIFHQKEDFHIGVIKESLVYAQWLPLIMSCAYDI